MIRLNIDGSKDTSFDIGTGFNSTVRTISIQSDGKIFVGTSSSTYQGIVIRGLIRLNTDGSRDTSFDIGTGVNNPIESIILQSDGKIIVGGSFTTYQLTSVNRIMRLNTDGSRDTSFDIGTGFDDSVSLLSTQSDGKIIVGGNYTTYQGISANKLIRLNTDGSRDTSFDIGTGFDSFINTISIQSDGKIILGGFFTSYQGISANRIITLNGDNNNSCYCITATDTLGAQYETGLICLLPEPTP